MSKLTVVREALESNPDVVIVDVIEQNYFPGKVGWWSHTIDYRVAPKTGLYTADELQAFMLGLVPDLEPTTKDPFQSYLKQLDFGKLYFDETIGATVQGTLTLTDEEFLGDKDLVDRLGLVDGKTTIDKNVTEEYERRTFVKLYPNEAVARDIINHKLNAIGAEHWIALKDLKSYNPDYHP